MVFFIDSLTPLIHILGVPAVWHSALSWDYHASVISTFKSRALFYPLGYLKQTGSQCMPVEEKSGQNKIIP